jgi:glutamate carboxypeptidase
MCFRSGMSNGPRHPSHSLAASVPLALALTAGTAAAVLEPPPAAAAEVVALSRTERALAAHVDAHLPAAEALLERAVNVNSGTLNFDGVRKVGEIFDHELAALGLETRWIEGAAFGRAGHLFARHAPRKHRGARPLRVLLIGHLDTVFEADSPFQRFERLPGNRAKGPGVIDMKGGDVIIVQALAALRAVGALDRIDVTVAMMGDEEAGGGPGTRDDLEKAAEGMDVVLGFEDGDGDPTRAMVARRGYSGWTLTVGGHAAHSSQIFQPEVGAGAVFEASRILAGFYDALSAEKNLSFSPGLILGGGDVQVAEGNAAGSASGKSNIVAREVTAFGDLRAISREQFAHAKETMQGVTERHLPGTTAELVFRDGNPPMAPAPGNYELLAMLDQVARDLGLPPVTAVDPRNAGAADIAFVADKIPRALDALGLKGSGGHTVDETADLDTLPTQTKKAALLLYRLAQKPPGTSGR